MKQRLFYSALTLALLICLEAGAQNNNDMPPAPPPPPPPASIAPPPLEVRTGTDNEALKRRIHSPLLIMKVEGHKTSANDDLQTNRLVTQIEYFGY